MYVMRLLPAGRQFQNSGAPDPARFGYSKPCNRCLRALHAAGVHRVIFSTGGLEEDGGIGREVCLVSTLLSSSGHSSRGDRKAVACGVLMPREICGECE